MGKLKIENKARAGQMLHIGDEHVVFAEDGTAQVRDDCPIFAEDGTSLAPGFRILEGTPKKPEAARTEEGGGEADIYAPGPLFGQTVNAGGKQIKFDENGYTRAPAHLFRGVRGFRVVTDADKKRMAEEEKVQPILQWPEGKVFETPEAQAAPVRGTVVPNYGEPDPDRARPNLRVDSGPVPGGVDKQHVIFTRTLEPPSPPLPPGMTFSGEGQHPVGAAIPTPDSPSPFQHPVPAAAFREGGPGGSSLSGASSQLPGGPAVDQTQQDGLPSMASSGNRPGGRQTDNSFADDQAKESQESPTRRPSRTRDRGRSESQAPSDPETKAQAQLKTPEGEGDKAPTSDQQGGSLASGTNLAAGE
jgi:hypothetical protein